jgi:uncharacterized protein (DUF362 family)/NAD-dependent dihydropyrimidine dehydrogenase PreA subunit
MNKIEHEKNLTVSIERFNYSNIDLKSLLSPLGGIKNYIKTGEKVLIKVNLLNASIPEKAVVTHPNLIKSVVKEVLEVGGIPYIGDSPSGQFSKRRLDKVYERAGLIELANEMGIELNYNTSYTKINIPDGIRLKKAPICEFVRNADKIIALPKLKTHSFMIMTLATKIMYGAIPGLTKARYHSNFFKKDSFADMLLDILTIVKPDLVIMDGIIGMEGDGPFSGMPIDLNLLLASENSVAIDLAICKILDINPIGIPTLKKANLRKLWPTKIYYPILKPKDVEYKGFKLPSTAGYILTGKKIPVKSPKPQDTCTGCGECVQICPMNAIKIISKKASIDYSKCIRCFCCHEVCTESAIKLVVIKK